jgi:hypothetical protein
MFIKNLETMPYAQAAVMYTNGRLVLRSYETDVVVIENGWLMVTGLYSATTRRHIGAFMKEYGYGDYQTAKMLYENDYALNIETGEVLTIEELQE